MIANSFKFVTLMLAVAVLMVPANAQEKKYRASLPASVTQTLGMDCEITIAYHRPGVRGRDIWNDKSDNEVIGRLVPHDEDPRPWRAGANNATTITLSQDVKVEGKDLAAGTYALFMVPRSEGDWTVIFSKKPKQWGTFTYNKDDDALRVEVTPEDAPHQEWLVYGFDDCEKATGTAFLHWEKKKIPFKIEVVE
jgi:hypothetical protein